MVLNDLVMVSADELDNFDAAAITRSDWRHVVLNNLLVVSINPYYQFVHDLYRYINGINLLSIYQKCINKGRSHSSFFLIGIL